MTRSQMWHVVYACGIALMLVAALALIAMGPQR